jgi:hypothetical protein
MDAVTTDLGNNLRTFKQRTCSEFSTKELQRESAARIRRQNRSPQLSTSSEPRRQRSQLNPSTSRPTSARGPQSATPDEISGTVKSNDATRRPKTLNLNTYKFHALGDYANTIRKFGTTDSYSTELVGLSYILRLWWIDIVAPGRARAPHTEIKISTNEQEGLHKAVDPN